MNGAHTPGPWSVESDGAGIYVVTPDMMIASPSPMDPHHNDSDEFIDGPITEANARLIAAAPCLLEALITFVDFPADTFDGDEDGAFTMTVRLNDLRAARAAIAKATGEGA